MISQRAFSHSLKEQVIQDFVHSNAPSELHFYNEYLPALWSSYGCNTLMHSMKTIYKWLNNVQQASRNVEMKTTDSVYDNLQPEKDSVTESTKQLSLSDGLHNRVFGLPNHPVEQLELMTPLLFLLATVVVNYYSKK